MSSVKENMMGYTPHQLKDAKAARKLYQAIGSPSLENMKMILKQNLIEDCSVTTKDVSISVKLCPPVSNRDIDQSVLLLKGECPQLEHSIPKDDVWSLATGQLRTSWGQPTARVCLCCSKVPTRVFS